MQRLGRSFAVPVLAASLMLLGACSSSTSSGAKSTAKDTKVTTTAGSSTTAKAPKDSTATTSGGGDVKASGSYCDMVKKINAKAAEIFAPQQGSDPAASLKNLQDGMASFIDLAHQVQAKAPAEIQTDVDFRVKEFEKLNALVQKLDAYSPEALASMTGEGLNSAEAKQHDDRIEAYEKNTCGIDPNAENSSSDTGN